MTHLQAWVYKTDGTAAVEHTERDDEEGRVAMDKWAFEKLLDAKVKSVKVEQVRRIAGGKRGTYR